MLMNHILLEVLRGCACLCVSVCVGSKIWQCQMRQRGGLSCCCPACLQCHSKAKWGSQDLRKTETTGPCETARKQYLVVDLSSVSVCCVPPRLIVGGSKLGRGDMWVVPCALRQMPAHSESAAVIQTCTGSLHLSQGPCTTPSD